MIYKIKQKKIETKQSREYCLEKISFSAYLSHSSRTWTNTNNNNNGLIEQRKYGRIWDNQKWWGDY